MTFINHPAMAALLTLSLTALAGCASAQVPSAAADFSGGWHVKWCDRSNPTLHCGGFDITLVQEGTRLCGDFGGALVNLRQIDEGTLVGTVVGNTAVIAVESNRTSSISLVRAEHRGDTLKWRVVDQIRKADNNDTDIIANDDELERDAQSTKKAADAPTRTCSQIIGR